MITDGNFRAASSQEGTTDEACKDQARFFFPCREIVHIQNGHLMSWPKPPTVNELTKRMNKYLNKEVRRSKLGMLPKKIDDFLNIGLCRERRPACFSTAAALARFGWQFDVAKEAILSAPFDRSGLSAKDLIDLERQIENGYKAGIATRS